MYIIESTEETTELEKLSGVEVQDNNLLLSLDAQGFHVETKGRWTGDPSQLYELLLELAIQGKEVIDAD